MKSDPASIRSGDPDRAVAPIHRCRLCGGPVAFALSARDRTRGDSPSFDYVECTGCGCLQIASIPDELERSYPAAYYTTRQRVFLARAGGFFGWRRGRTRMRLALGRDPITRLLSGRRYGRFEWFRRTATGIDDAILDVGCGSGRLLFRLQADGFRRLVGIDPRLSPETAARAQSRPGLRLESTSPTAHARTHAGTYQLVMAHHSFEHMRDPLREWAAMTALVAPGGWLLLRVPLADAWARAHYGADWAQLDAPRHLQIPTRRGIEALAEGAEFVLEHVEDDSGVFQIWGSERDRPRGRLARWLRWWLARRRAAQLRRAGRGDQGVFYLRRGSGADGPCSPPSAPNASPD